MSPEQGRRNALQVSVPGKREYKDIHILEVTAYTTLINLIPG